METKTQTMLALQDAMNRHVHTDWRTRGFAWYRAIWIECAELMDHYGWKWWKHQEVDRPQVVLELVDIWHFGLSDMLLRYGQGGQAPAAEASNELLADIERAVDIAFAQEVRGDDFLSGVEVFAQNTLASRQFDLEGFARLTKLAGLSFDELYGRYIGKNVLNTFRQDKGYKQGTYAKIWGGKEDNVHLMELLATLDVDDPSFQQELYRALDARYPAVAELG